ncbi:hypothetical protein T11_8169 [Trichinella zimbabwensis]|uniref:Uncharacterized protein n=1 Tax=Trichinella zimbabwensis TaxID=268475 RepID=A0A0V1HRJ4_9BILA|nr:hypothetical protein T11_8169 [Trichinella zimbabwensis]
MDQLLVCRTKRLAVKKAKHCPGRRHFGKSVLMYLLAVMQIFIKQKVPKKEEAIRREREKNSRKNHSWQKIASECDELNAEPKPPHSPRFSESLQLDHVRLNK